jgi:hypothetical protein
MPVKHGKRMGVENTRNIHRIIVDPVNPNTVMQLLLEILMAFILKEEFLKQLMAAKHGQKFYIPMILPVALIL